MSDIDESELEVFVSRTLQAIVSGIASAQRSTRPKGNTLVLEVDGDPTGQMIGGVRIPLAHQLEFEAPNEVTFDVAVNISRKSGKSGGLKLEVLRVGANASMDHSREQTTASRIVFSVPVKRKSSTY